MRTFTSSRIGFWLFHKLAIPCVSEDFCFTLCDRYSMCDQVDLFCSKLYIFLRLKLLQALFSTLIDFSHFYL